MGRSGRSAYDIFVVAKDTTGLASGTSTATQFKIQVQGLAPAAPADSDGTADEVSESATGVTKDCRRSGSMRALLSSRLLNEWAAQHDFEIVSSARIFPYVAAGEQTWFLLRRKQP